MTHQLLKLNLDLLNKLLVYSKIYHYFPADALRKYQKTYKNVLLMHFLCLQMFTKDILMLKTLGESTYISANVILVLKKLNIPTKLHNCNNDEIHENSSSSSDTSNSNLETEHKFNELPNNGCSLSIVLNVLRISGLDTIFPTLNVAPERTFSKLTIIKNILQSTMCQESLDNLMILSCESDIPINKNNIIDEFSKSSVHLEKALLY